MASSVEVPRHHLYSFLQKKRKTGGTDRVEAERSRCHDLQMSSMIISKFRAGCLQLRYSNEKSKSLCGHNIDGDIEVWTRKLSRCPVIVGEALNIDLVL